MSERTTPCPTCEGRGIVPKRDRAGNFVMNETMICPDCKGKAVRNE